MTFAEGYVDVATRIAEFYEKYPDGSLQMDPPKMETIDGVLFLVGRAYAYRTPDDVRPGIGHAWEVVPGRTPYTKGSELMVLETSCWGRALAALGISTRQGIASADEVKAAQERQPQTVTTTARGGPLARAQARDVSQPATPKQIGMLKRTMAQQHVTEYMLADFAKTELGFELPVDGLDHLTKHQASALIDGLLKVQHIDAAKTTRLSGPDPDDPWAAPVDPITGEVAG